ncbi:MAG: histidine phosphatase family protein [Propionibacterium sp.]|nr:histidine phosphatase family protein [Propionibacterium sp.]
MTRLIVLRHGETQWNRERRMQGVADVELNDAGLAQAREAAEELAGYRFDAVYSSPLRRASETARIVAAPHGLPLQLDARLSEINVGSWAGRTAEEVREEFPGQQELYFAGQDYHRSAEGESAAQVGDRAEAAVADIAGAHPTGTVLVVSHGYFAQLLVSRLLGLEGFGNRLAALRNAHWCDVRHEYGRWYLHAYNLGRDRVNDVVGTADSPAPRS